MPTLGDYTMRAQPRRRVQDDKEEPVFLRKTFEMICSCDTDSATDLACWSPSGETFIVKDCDAFAQEIIPRFFKHNKFSSFVRQLNFYGFRKVKSNISADDAEAKWWEFKHDLFRRNKPHLLATMKRATHYGAPVDSKEVEDLRSEVNRLRSHIDDMGDKIGQLTSLVEALAMEGVARPTASCSALAAADPIRGVRREAGVAGRGWGMEDADGLGDVGVGLGRLSFDCCREDHDEEDSKLFPPAAPAGAGCSDAAAFLPLHVMSRKRKLMAGNVSCGDGVEDGCGNDGVASPWTSGAAASGVVVKQDMIVDSRLRVAERPAIKSEMMDEGSISERPTSWPSYAQPPSAPLATPDPADGASSGSDSPKAAFCSTPSLARGNSGDFFEGFTEQFLSFESLPASYVFTDRVAGPGASPATPLPAEAAAFVAQDGPACDKSRGGGSGEGVVATVGRGSAMTDIDVDLDADGSDCRSQSEGEEHIDIEGGVGMLTSAMSTGLEGTAAAPALAYGNSVVRLGATETGEGGVATAARAIPGPSQDSLTAATGSRAAASQLPLGLEELLPNLESLPLHSKTKLKEGLSALMQHPTFLAALVGQGQGNGVPVTPGASKEEAPAARPSDVVSNIVNVNNSNPSVSHKPAMSDDGGNPSRACTPAAGPADGGSDSVTADGASGSSSSSNGAGSGVGGAGSGGCCPGRSQGRGEFRERLPRSEEACA